MTIAKRDGNARERILHHLQQVGHITPIEALTIFGIQRLAPRIEELRREGFVIDTKVRMDTQGRRYCRYEIRAVGTPVFQHTRFTTTHGRSFFGTPLTELP